MLRILQYSLIRDVQASLKRPRCPHSAFLQPPLVVLQGFGTEQHMKLVAVLFQNMFPAINVSTTKLSDCQVGHDVHQCVLLCTTCPHHM